MINNTSRPGMLGFAKDLPNVCSLLGLLCTVFGIYYAIQGSFVVSIIAILWAVLFDWYDGIIARKMKGRTKEQSHFGAQLDSLIDIVSFGIFPAILLLSYGNYNIWFIPGSFILVATSALRLSYFNVYGLIDSKTYKGLALDNNMLLVSFLFLFENNFSHSAFSYLLYTFLMALSAFNVSSIPTPKFGGKWVYALVVYVIFMTLILR
ncbi:MAG: phosphatidylcholine/phosphatidylserine synthase [Rhodothermaceae bacterium]